MKVVRLGVVLSVAGCVLAVAAAGPVAASPLRRAATPGWRVAHVFGGGCGDVEAVTAVAANAGWAAGSMGQCSGSTFAEPLIARWDGRSWQQLRPPSQFINPPGQVPLSGTAMAALSTSYAWTFLSDEGSDSYALLWNSGHWRVYRLTRTIATFGSAVVFSPSDAWVFGTVGDNEYPAVLHFNGRAWRQVRVPVTPISAAAPTRRNIWIAGTAKSGFRGRDLLAHWTGRRWRTIAFPKFKVPAGFGLFPGWVVAGGKAGAWVSATISTFSGAGSSTLLLLHWTGKVWVRIKPPFHTDDLGPLVRDGHGGLWLAGTNCGATTCRTPVIAHYSASGAWSLSRTRPLDTEVLDMRLIPGTRSVWAGGITAGSIGSAVMLKYGP